MKAEELSIANVSVSFLYEFVNKFTDIEIPKEAIKETLDQLYDFKPIPITEDWLLDLGFEKEEGKLYSLYVDDNLDVSLWSDTYFSNPTIELTCNGRVVCKDIKYVHELQNLYFALTGKELKTIKR